jgi:hypothetical protein
VAAALPRVLFAARLLMLCLCFAPTAMEAMSKQQFEPARHELTRALDALLRVTELVLDVEELASAWSPTASTAPIAQYFAAQTYHNPQSQVVYDEIGAVLDSRATAYGKLQRYTEALRDAKACCVMRPDWSRGFSVPNALASHLYNAQSFFVSD